MKKAIIVGASSGIGAQLARVMAADGWELGLTARREDLLVKLRDELGSPVTIRSMDVTRVAEAMAGLEELLQAMAPVSTVVLSAGIGMHNMKLEWGKEEAVLAVNVTGFAAMANVAFNHFVKAGGGHLVGISSVARHRGSPYVPAYAASKAFASSYLEGLRLQAFKRRLAIAVTDVRPGYVDTAMTKGQKGMFWLCPVEETARQIYEGIKAKRKTLYVTRKWALVGAAMTVLPEALYRKF